MPLPLLHGSGGIGWEDWPWYAAFFAFGVAVWFLLQWLKKRWKPKP